MNTKLEMRTHAEHDMNEVKTHVDEVLHRVDRSDFVPPEIDHVAHMDRALLIGHGQTISQPSTVRCMLEWLNVRPGNKVLDLGSGSGWTTALLSHLVGEQGHVYAVERIPELVDFGRRNCQRVGIHNTTFLRAEDGLGMPTFAPYDRILVSATTNRIPDELVEQLKDDGQMVIPVGNDIAQVQKHSNGDITSKFHHGFVFVPLVG